MDEFLITLPRKDRTEEFSHDAGGAVDQAFMKLFQNGLGDERTFSVKFEVRQCHHAVQVAQAGDVLRKDDDMTVLLAVGIRICRDLIDHVPLHAIDDLLVILVCKILDLRKRLNDAMIRDRDRRMMPLCCRLDDLFIVDKTIEAHFRVQMKLDTGRLVIVLVVDLDCLSLFHLRQLQHKPAGVLVEAHIAAHLDRRPRLQRLDSFCLLGAVEKFLARDAIRFIGEIHEKELLFAAKLADLDRDHRADKNDTILLFIHSADLDGLSRDMLPSKVYAIHCAAFFGSGRGRYESTLRQDTRKRWQTARHGDPRHRCLFCHCRYRHFRFLRRGDVVSGREDRDIRRKAVALHGLFRRREIHRRHIRIHHGRCGRKNHTRHIIAIDIDRFHACQSRPHIFECLQCGFFMVGLDVPCAALCVDLHQSDDGSRLSGLQTILSHRISFRGIDNTGGGISTF